MKTNAWKLALTALLLGTVHAVQGDVLDADIRRTEAGWLVLRAVLSDAGDSPNIRWLLDGQDHAGEPRTGADFMVEGDRAFRYPPGAVDWSWNEADPPLMWAVKDTRYWILREPPFESAFRWRVELYDEAWNPQSRFPADDDAAFRPGAAHWRYPDRLFPENMAGLTAGQPVSLSFRLDAELKNRIWEKPGEPVLPVWTPPHAPVGLPLRLFLVDASSDTRTELPFGEGMICSNKTLWTGQADRLRWSVMTESVSPGEMELSVLLESTNECCLSVGMGCTLSPGDWTWHDDPYRRRYAAEDEGSYENTVPSPFGRRGLQSIYPFGVLSAGETVVAIETDVEEPRVCHIMADPARRFAGVVYDVALTPKTSNFPGQAAFRCRVSELAADGRNAFRVAAEDFLRRHPDYMRARLATAGVGAAIPDMRALSNRADVGFAFGWLGPDWARGDGVPPDMTVFMPSSPWLFRLPLDTRWTWTEADVMEWLNFLMAVSPEAEAGYMSAALLGCARNPNGSPRIEWTRDEDGLMAVMELNVDPDLAPMAQAPLSPAMMEWRLIRALLAKGTAQGIVIEELGALHTLDDRTSAARVTDHPCVYAKAELRSGVAMPHAALEFVSAAAGYLHRDARYLMGKVDLKSLPFLARHLDVFSMETGVLTEEADRMSEESLWAATRVLSGAKPVCALWRCPPAKATPEAVERYFDLCSVYGFLPGFADVAGDNVWKHPEQYEKLRGLFRTRLPLLNRLVFAGWQANGNVRVSLPEVVAERFGNGVSALGHVSVRNLSSEAVTFDLEVPAPLATTVLMNPLSGWCRMVPEDGTVRLTLAGRASKTLDMIPWSARGQETLFLESWATEGREAEAGLRTMRSMATELAGNIFCYMDWSDPVVKGEDNRAVLHLQNAGKVPVQVSNFKIISSKHFRDVDPAETILVPGESRTVEMPFYAHDVTDQPWLEAQWKMVQLGRTNLCERLFRPVFVDALDIRLERSRVQTEDGAYYLSAIMRNHSSRARSVMVRVQGDAQGSMGPINLQSSNSVNVKIPLKRPRHEVRQCVISLFEEGDQLAERSFLLDK